MNLSNLWSQIENELAWRQSELRFLNNQIEKLDNENDKKTLRRSAILMLYAHFEGFTKFSFELYINAINNENLRCAQVNHHIVACSMNDVFKELRNPNSKTNIFRNSLPDDTMLHRFARNVHFLQSLDEKLSQLVSIPESIIDTESNLKPKVISKLLYSIGLNHNLFESEYGAVNRLLNIRNKIGHGEMRRGLEEQEFNDLYNISINILTVIKSKIMESLTNRNYLRPSSN